MTQFSSLPLLFSVTPSHLNPYDMETPSNHQRNERRQQVRSKKQFKDANTHRCDPRDKKGRWLWLFHKRYSLVSYSLALIYNIPRQLAFLEVSS